MITMLELEFRKAKIGMKEGEKKVIS